MHIVRERTQRRHIDDAKLVFQRLFERLFEQAVDTGQKGGQRLAAAGRCGDQGVLTSGDIGPAQLLRFGRRGEPRMEPLRDDGMEAEE